MPRSRYALVFIILGALTAPTIAAPGYSVQILSATTKDKVVEGAHTATFRAILNDEISVRGREFDKHSTDLIEE